MLAIDDVVIMGSSTLQALGIDVYDILGEDARKQAVFSGKGVERADFQSLLSSERIN